MQTSTGSPGDAPGPSGGLVARRLPASLRAHLRLPLVVAPMLHVSGPSLVAAACRSGVIGAFPTLNAELVDGVGLSNWLRRIDELLEDTGGQHAPVCANIVMRHRDRERHCDILAEHGVKMVITSVGSPEPVIRRLHAAGIFVLSDVASLDHARKAIDAGADGLVLLSAGAGGQTGWLNGFAFTRAVRIIFDGVILLAGGLADGSSLLAAEALGADLGYMGTRFIGATESLADRSYRQQLVEASMDDIVLTRAFNGLWGSFIRQSIEAAGFDPARLNNELDEAEARKAYGRFSNGPQRWKDIRSAGHSVDAVRDCRPAAAIVAEIAASYRDARQAFAAAACH